MGVHHLWKILDPVKKPVKIESLKGQTLAVDLSVWICDAQGVKQMQGHVAKPHLRNLFFRVSYLLQLGVNLIFVVDGEAPEVKWEAMIMRQQARYGHMGGHSQKTMRKPGRANFKRLVNEACEMLEYLGVPYVQSVGEAEAFCALLNKEGVADCVVTQDGDAFLYGATKVYKNFTINTKDSSIDSYSLVDVESQLNLNRDKLVALGILLGCDYVPKGVPGVGKETAMKFMMELSGTESILEKFRVWRRMSTQSSKVPAIEVKIRSKALEIPEFPFEKVIKEFMVIKDRCPRKTPEWKKPRIDKLYEFNEKLEWPTTYTNEKVIPLMTLHDLRTKSKNCGHRPEPKPDRIVKARVRQFVPCFEVQWEKLDYDTDPENTQAFYTTFEERELFTQCYPELVSAFDLENKKPSKGERKPRKKKGENETKEKHSDHLSESPELNLADLHLDPKNESQPQNFEVVSSDAKYPKEFPHDSIRNSAKVGRKVSADQKKDTNTQRLELANGCNGTEMSNNSSIADNRSEKSRVPEQMRKGPNVKTDFLSLVSKSDNLSENEDLDPSEPEDLVTRLRRLRLAEAKGKTSNLDQGQGQTRPAVHTSKTFHKRGELNSCDVVGSTMLSVPCDKTKESTPGFTSHEADDRSNFQRKVQKNYQGKFQKSSVKQKSISKSTNFSFSKQDLQRDTVQAETCSSLDRSHLTNNKVSVHIGRDRILDSHCQGDQSPLSLRERLRAGLLKEWSKVQQEVHETRSLQPSTEVRIENDCQPGESFRSVSDSLLIQEFGDLEHPIPENSVGPCSFQSLSDSQIVMNLTADGNRSCAVSEKNNCSGFGTSISNEICRNGSDLQDVIKGTTCPLSTFSFQSLNDSELVRGTSAHKFSEDDKFSKDDKFSEDNNFSEDDEDVFEGTRNCRSCENMVIEREENLGHAVGGESRKAPAGSHRGNLNEVSKSCPGGETSELMHDHVHDRIDNGSSVLSKDLLPEICTSNVGQKSCPTDNLLNHNLSAWHQYKMNNSNPSCSLTSLPDLSRDICSGVENADQTLVDGSYEAVSVIGRDCTASSNSLTLNNTSCYSEPKYQNETNIPVDRSLGDVSAKESNSVKNSERVDCKMSKGKTDAKMKNPGQPPSTKSIDSELSVSADKTDCAMENESADSELSVHEKNYIGSVANGKNTCVPANHEDLKPASEGPNFESLRSSGERSLSPREMTDFDGISSELQGSDGKGRQSLENSTQSCAPRKSHQDFGNSVLVPLEPFTGSNMTTSNASFEVSTQESNTDFGIVPVAFPSEGEIEDSSGTVSAESCCNPAKVASSCIEEDGVKMYTEQPYVMPKTPAYVLMNETKYMQIKQETMTPQTDVPNLRRKEFASRSFVRVKQEPVTPKFNSGVELARIGLGEAKGAEDCASSTKGFKSGSNSNGCFPENFTSEARESGPDCFNSYGADNRTCVTVGIKQEPVTPKVGDVGRPQHNVGGRTNPGKELERKASTSTGEFEKTEFNSVYTDSNLTCLMGGPAFQANGLPESVAKGLPRASEAPTLHGIFSNHRVKEEPVSPRVNPACQPVLSTSRCRESDALTLKNVKKEPRTPEETFRNIIEHELDTSEPSSAHQVRNPVIESEPCQQCKDLILSFGTKLKAKPLAPKIDTGKLNKSGPSSAHEVKYEDRDFRSCQQKCNDLNATSEKIGPTTRGYETCNESEDRKLGDSGHETQFEKPPRRIKEERPMRVVRKSSRGQVKKEPEYFPRRSLRRNSKKVEEGPQNLLKTNTPCDSNGTCNNVNVLECEKVLEHEKVSEREDTVLENSYLKELSCKSGSNGEEHDYLLRSLRSNSKKVKEEPRNSPINLCSEHCRSSMDWECEKVLEHEETALENSCLKELSCKSDSNEVEPGTCNYPRRSLRSNSEKVKEEPQNSPITSCSEHWQNSMDWECEKYSEHEKVLDREDTALGNSSLQVSCTSCSNGEGFRNRFQVPDVETVRAGAEMLSCLPVESVQNRSQVRSVHIESKIDRELNSFQNDTKVLSLFDENEMQLLRNDSKVLSVHDENQVLSAPNRTPINNNQLVHNATQIPQEQSVQDAHSSDCDPTSNPEQTSLKESSISLAQNCHSVPQISDQTLHANTMDRTSRTRDMADYSSSNQGTADLTSKFLYGSLVEEFDDIVSAGPEVVPNSPLPQARIDLEGASPPMEEDVCPAQSEDCVLLPSGGDAAGHTLDNELAMLLGMIAERKPKKAAKGKKRKTKNTKKKVTKPDALWNTILDQLKSNDTHSASILVQTLQDEDIEELLRVVGASATPRATRSRAADASRMPEIREMHADCPVTASAKMTAKSFQLREEMDSLVGDVGSLSICHVEKENVAPEYRAPSSLVTPNKTNASLMEILSQWKSTKKSATAEKGASCEEESLAVPLQTPTKIQDKSLMDILSQWKTGEKDKLPKNGDTNQDDSLMMLLQTSKRVDNTTLTDILSQWNSAKKEKPVPSKKGKKGRKKKKVAMPALKDTSDSLDVTGMLAKLETETLEFGT